MAVVYQARQISLDRVVALKMIRSGDLAGPEELSRFQSEAKAIARLKHPNIVHIYEVEANEGRPYFSLEYVEGGSLAQKIKGIPQPPRAAAEMVETLARAVHAAHQRRIIHRDLKPTNVLLTPDGVPKISDFGLAKCLDPDATQTRTGAVMGTPSYMAPEQAAGKSKEIGPAADVYSLGAILYELLTGRPPFLADSWEATRQLVVSQEPVPPRRLQPKLPRDLETICLKCLEKEPARRMPSAQALAEDLRRYLDGKPIRSRPIGPAGRLWRWSRRHPIEAVLTCGLLFTFMTGTLVASYFALEAIAEAATAKANEKTAEEQRWWSDHRRYAAEIQLAKQNWRDGQIGVAKRLLQGLEQDLPELRGFEWYYLQRLCHLDLHTLQEQGGGVTCIAYSPDGCRLAWGGVEKTVKVWNCSKACVEHNLIGHTDDVLGIAFSSDG
jgi:serine/threonine-protein kinase